ncbi:phage tail sheath subtilisin-like domain-containing protein [Chachezhania antarctica]|uniref:phage tail sheath subtilisin-like domain-containing protein n=1 Tax=Chachezhania antarctica TaxID=2340860 RepID=UPI0013CEAD3A|nr:phage tail sheath subtilisin-like domain-containing protein [Chachezhania antarctica]
MVTLTYPGVYVVEEPSGVRPISGASTSVGLFIGRAQKGPINTPVRLSNFTEFSRVFGDGGAVSDMARYVRMFFTNGGADMYVMRIANGAGTASVTLSNEAAAADDVLTLTAKEAGASGEQIRAIVRPSGEEPEARFNLELYRWAPNAAGVVQRSDVETYQNLTMDPNDPLYAVDYLTQESALVSATDPGAPAAVNGSSLSGRYLLRSSVADAQGALATVFDDAPGAPGGTHLRLSVDGLPFVTIDLSDRGPAIAGSGAGDVPTLYGDEVLSIIEQRVTQAYADIGSPGIAVTATLEDGGQVGGDDTGFLQIASTNAGDIRVRPATTGKDLSVPLMMGPGNGGIEIGAHAMRRPAQSGLAIRVSDLARLNAFGFANKSGITDIRLDGFDAAGAPATVEVPVPLAAGAAPGDPVIVDTYPTAAQGNSDGVRQRLMQIRDAINADAATNPTLNPWTAVLNGLRLSITRASDLTANRTVPALSTIPTNLSAMDAGLPLTNVPRFCVGAEGGSAGTQASPAAPATDGNPPQSADYDAAYAIVDRQVKIFNLMVLPPDREVVQDMQPLYGPATAFCRQRRAMLIMDPPGNLTPQQMTTEVNTLRTGIARDHAALYYPRILINEAGRNIAIGAAGAMAGLMARTDATRGVYKAPAGQDLPFFGVVGVQRELSNAEVGILNPRGVNCITRAPAGVRPWGARTMDGDDDFASEYKYVPVRRVASYISQSLYDGLQWVVFEPNGDILWSQIRQNVNAFMGRLHRQNFFKGDRKSDAYFVKCDAETTTQADIDVGVVNVWVGFAPLKPTEFVVIHLQQMAGQQDV